MEACGTFWIGRHSEKVYKQLFSEYDVNSSVKTKNVKGASGGGRYIRATTSKGRLDLFSSKINRAVHRDIYFANLDKSRLLRLTVWRCQFCFSGAERNPSCILCREFPKSILVFYMKFSGLI